MSVKKLVLYSVLTLLFLSCDTLSQLANLANCNYAIQGLANPKVGGISISNLNNINELSATALLKLGTAVLSGSLPFSADMKIMATNPNTGTAQIEGLDWALDFENSNILKGSVSQRVTVPPKGNTVIPFNIQMDIMELTTGKSKDDIYKLVNSLLNVGESSSKVSFRINPKVMVGGNKISTGFITLSKAI